MTRVKPRRSGIVALAVMVCMLIVVALSTAMIRTALRAHRESSRHRQLRQTELLLDAGISRAVTRFNSDADYREETWDLPDDTFSSYRWASVTITVELAPDADSPGPDASDVKTPKTVTVVARIAPHRGSADVTQRSTQFEIGE